MYTASERAAAAALLTYAMLTAQWKAEADKTMYFCGCKATAKAPFCDGTHQRL